jgi:hypothetical protein
LTRLFLLYRLSLGKRLDLFFALNRVGGIGHSVAQTRVYQRVRGFWPRLFVAYCWAGKLPQSPEKNDSALQLGPAASGYAAKLGARGLAPTITPHHITYMTNCQEMEMPGAKLPDSMIEWILNWV